MKVWLKTSEGQDALIDPEDVSHITPSGLPGCSVLHSKKTGFLILVLGDGKDVAEVLWPAEVIETKEWSTIP